MNEEKKTGKAGNHFLDVFLYSFVDSRKTQVQVCLPCL